MRKILALLAVVAVTVGLLEGCGGGQSSQAAADKVCSARTQLHDSMNTVKQDVTSANFGKAKDGLSQVKKDFNNLVEATKGLAHDKAQALSPQIDALKKELANLKNVSSLSELANSLGTISSEVQALYAKVTDTLKCS